MNEKISRREFLKKAGLVSAGAVMGNFILSPKSYARVNGANDRVNVAVVGFSDRFRSSLLPGFTDHREELNFDMIGVSDIWSLRRDEGVQVVGEKIGHKVKGYRNNEEMYKDKDIDAVIISTPDFAHATHTVEAAEHGKHIYVEKPFAETMEDNRRARAAVEKAGVIFQVGSQRRSAPNYHAANDYIRSGQFGDIVMCEMTWNVNQPGRWRRPSLVPKCREEDLDWIRFLCNRPFEAFDPRKYLEYRLFWPYSSGIPGQWMAHQIDTVHWFTGLKHPRSVTANGGIYLWHDGRTNFDTMTAVMDYGPADDPQKGFLVQYTSRFTNSAGSVKEIYYSNGGELNLDTNKITPNGGLTEGEAKAMGMHANQLAPLDLKSTMKVATAGVTGVDPMTSVHVRNWMECIRSGEKTNAPVEAAYDHSSACIMVNAALRTKQYVTFDEEHQEVLAGGKVFKF